MSENSVRSNGASQQGADPVSQDAAPQISPEMLGKIAGLRAQVRESFGKIVMAMMALPRYRHQTLADLQPLVLEPLIRDRIAIAHPKGTDRTALVDIAGFAIWASVSQEVDLKIREQIKTGTFPIRLKAEDWQSGEVNWLLDVIAPDAKATGQVIANFRQVVKEGDLRIHPMVAGLVDAEMRGKMMGGLNGTKENA